MQSSIALDDNHESNTASLSWGPAEELLVGNTRLTIHATHDTPETIWSKEA